VLKITELKKSYRNFPVLTGLNMAIEKGDVYGFLGTNGCGKTTTMNIICNIITKDEGDIAFESENVKIGYLPESPSLYGYMNGFEYLDFIGACCNYSGDIKKRTAEVLDVVGMTKAARRLVGGYSRGMNQRVGIAAAIYAHPDLLILDEPTSALDPEGRAEVMNIITRLSQSGATIILCTHILTDVERAANKVGILKDGVMAIEGELNEVLARCGGGNALQIRLRTLTSEAAKAICGIDLAERSETLNHSITLYAKDNVTERELYNKVIITLNENDILPEAVEFRRLTLEQIYIGVNDGTLTPDGSAAEVQTVNNNSERSAGL